MLTRVLLMAAFIVLASTLAVPAADRPTPVPNKAGRSVTLAQNGIVAASHPTAAQIGLEVL